MLLLTLLPQAATIMEEFTSNWGSIPMAAKSAWVWGCPCTCCVPSCTPGRKAVAEPCFNEAQIDSSQLWVVVVARTDKGRVLFLHMCRSSMTCGRCCCLQATSQWPLTARFTSFKVLDCCTLLHQLSCKSVSGMHDHSGFFSIPSQMCMTLQLYI